MARHPHPRSAEARLRRAERRRLRRRAAAAGITSVELLPPSWVGDARFVAAAAERIDRDRFASTSPMFQRAVEDLVEIDRSNKPRGAVINFADAS